MQSVPPPKPSRADFSSATWLQIIDSAVETAVIVLDPLGFVQVWSRGATEILGWTEEEMHGQTLDRLFTEADRQEGRIRAEMSDALATGRGGGEEGWRVRKDGSLIWAVGEMSPVHSEAGEHAGFVKILLDRTSQEKTRQALREERKALTILNRAGAALAGKTDLQELVQIVTDAGVELSGAQFGAFFYNVEDAAGESYMLYALSGVPREAFSSFPMPRNTQVFAPTFAGEGIVRSDDIMADPRYGHSAPYKGMPKGHLPVRSYLAVPVISRTGEVIGGLFFGHEQIGVFDLRSEQSLVGLAGEAAIAIDNARLARANEAELRQRRDAEAQLLTLNATLEERIRQRTEELERQAAALRQLQKMEAIGQLTGGIAHDFNNMLQVIVGNLEIIRRTVPPESTRALGAVQVALNSTRSGSAMTQRLLAFARRQPLDPKPTDANALVRSLSEMLYRTLGETIEIETVLAAGVWTTEVDTTELDRALLNLAVNARDAMPQGGKLTIETANAHVDENYAALNIEATPGQYVMISVSDTGEGMSAATLEQAFEPYFTTKPVGRGTGLGLSQVYGFVKQSGGHLKLYSELGIGTTVRMYLPRRHGAASDVRGQGAAGSAPQGGLEKVLVVEDDAQVRQLSVSTLVELGYEVVEAPDGPAALRLLDEIGAVDLLFTDVVLPGGMTGAELAAAASSRLPGLKVLYTTGYARNAIVHQGRLDPGVQLLTKPYSFADLASKVREVLDKPKP